jgi:WD40 repeat protein
MARNTIASFLVIVFASLAAAQERRIDLNPDLSAVTAIAFSPDGKRLLVGVESRGLASDRGLVMLDLNQAKPQPKPKLLFSERGSPPFRRIAWAPDSRTWVTLRSGEFNGNRVDWIDVWDAVTSKAAERIAIEPKEHVHDAIFLDRNAILTGGLVDKKKTGTYQPVLKAHDLREKQVLGEFPGPFVNRLTLVGESLMIISDEAVELHNVERKDGKLALAKDFTLKAPKALLCAAVSPDGKRVLTGGTEKRVRLWDKATRKLIAVFRGHSDDVRYVSFSHDGKSPVSWSADGSVRFWNVADEKEAKIWKCEGALSVFAISPDGKTIASGGPEGLRTWDVAKIQADK